MERKIDLTSFFVKRGKQMELQRIDLTKYLQEKVDATLFL